MTECSLSKFIKIGGNPIENVKIRNFLEEEYKRDTPTSIEGSEGMRQIFGGVKLVLNSISTSPFEDSSSELSENEEDDGMLFHTRSLKLMSKEERKEYLDCEHKSYKKNLKDIQIHSLWHFK